jgi:cardiolipin synthase (CMP-forming)
VYREQGGRTVDTGSRARGAAEKADGPAVSGQPPPDRVPPDLVPLPDGGGLPERVWTVPNVLSMARLAGVPVFLWLVLGPHANGWAVGLLAAAAATDWLDGKIARAFHQESRLGQVLDPAADRLYIAATIVALAVRAIIPWWLVGLLVARELVLGVALLRLRAHGYQPLQVSFVGKAATLCLLYAFPLLLLGAYAGPAATVARVAGWAFGIWGTALYWWAAGLYLVQTWQLTGWSAGGRARSGQP